MKFQKSGICFWRRSKSKVARTKSQSRNVFLKYSLELFSYSFKHFSGLWILVLRKLIRCGCRVITKDAFCVIKPDIITRQETDLIVNFSCFITICAEKFLHQSEIGRVYLQQGISTKINLYPIFLVTVFPHLTKKESRNQSITSYIISSALSVFDFWDVFFFGNCISMDFRIKLSQYEISKKDFGRPNLAPQYPAAKMSLFFITVTEDFLICRFAKQAKTSAKIRYEIENRRFFSAKNSIEAQTKL